MQVLYVLIVFAFLAVSGALTIRSLARIEQATLVVAELRPAEWGDVSAQLGVATDELRLCISDRIDR